MGRIWETENKSRMMNQLSKSLAVFNWASQRAEKDLRNTITKENLQACYEIQEEIGRGAYGIVRKCERKTDKATFAIKIILFKDPKLLKDIQREIAMMRKIHHENLVTLHEAYESAGSIAMLMDYIAGGELFERIIEKEYLTEKEAVCYLRQLIEGLTYMHSKNIVHLDIKPENILCVDSNSDRVKLIDFGLARELKPDEPTRCALGTPDFVAPEAISFNEIKPQTDMWSVGVLTYVLLSGLMPFGGDTDHETLCNISNVDWEFDEDSFCEISSDAQDFIENLLLLRPEDRMSAFEALEHRWIHETIERDGKINTKRHRTFLARRRWKKSVHVVMAVTKLCRIMQLSSNGRSRSGSSLSFQGSAEGSNESSERSVKSPLAENSKSDVDSESKIVNGPKDINGNETAACKDNSDTLSDHEINRPKQKELSEKTKENNLFSNVSLSNGNGESIQWKVFK